MATSKGMGMATGMGKGMGMATGMGMGTGTGPVRLECRRPLCDWALWVELRRIT
jgi:hypothetical protein